MNEGNWRGWFQESNWDKGEEKIEVCMITFTISNEEKLIFIVLC